MALLGKLALLRSARRYAGRHAGQVNSGVDKVADTVKGRLPDQHSGKVEGAATFLKKAATGRDEPGTSPRDDPPEERPR